MKRFIRLLFLLCMLVALAGASRAQAQFRYVVLPPTPDLPDDHTVSTWTSDINNHNQIAGYEIDPVGNHFVVLWAPGKQPAKLTIPEGYSYLWDGIEINDAGQVLTNLYLGGKQGTPSPALWTNGVATILPSGPVNCGSGAARSLGMALNNAGHVLGVTLKGTCATYWVWDGVQFHPITPPMAENCSRNDYSASSINNRDQVLGIQDAPNCPAEGGVYVPVVTSLSGQPVFYQPPSDTRLNVQYAGGLNDFGEVTGSALGDRGWTLGLLWPTATGEPIVIHSPNPRQNDPAPGAVNDHGEFVLSTQNDGGQYSYLWKKGVLTLLPPQGTTSPDAGGVVNDRGIITVDAFITGTLNTVRGLVTIPAK